MKNKIRILVTHQVHHLTKVDKIILLNNGEIKLIGTYNDLVESGVNMDVFETAENKNNQLESMASIESRLTKRTISISSKYSYDDPSELIAQLTGSQAIEFDKAILNSQVFF